MNEKYLEKLNQEQYNIVLNNNFIESKYAMCIIACAGSGKTTTIISKIIYMIQKLNCNPAEFFITTFTRNAASELKTRLSEHLKESQIVQMTIGTFHSIAYKYMIKYNQNKKEIIEDNIERRPKISLLDIN